MGMYRITVYDGEGREYAFSPLPGSLADVIVAAIVACELDLDMEVYEG